MTDRLPAWLEASALIRRVEVAGGFGVVIAKGDAEAGTILVVLTEKGANSKAYERLPDPDGSRKWHCVRHQTVDIPYEFGEYLERRRKQDTDLWIIELDIAHGERFIGLSAAVT
ncbi:MAG: hypothetical protein RLY97_566 [Pseudomonadota bacterium]|jgi:hypothetical protein